MQPPGSRVSDLIEAAMRVLKLYSPELLADPGLESKEAEAKKIGQPSFEDQSTPTQTQLPGNYNP
jgi:hypothetical protein